MMRGRDVFMQSLIANGAEVIFGNPGTTENPLLVTLDEHPELTYRVALHEGVAVCAAGAYAQASGRTGIANVHVAPGLGNAIGMMYGIAKAQVPVIVTAGAQDTRMRLREPLLGHDLVAMAEPVCKWAVQAEHADEIGPIMQRAFQVANTYPRGPVFVALPNNIMEQATDIGVSDPGHPLIHAAIDEGAIAHVLELLENASAPLIVAGDDIAVRGANTALIRLAEAIGATVRTDFLQARQVMPADHPNNAGAMPFEGAAISAIFQMHDLVLLTGAPRFDEVWFDPLSPIPEDVTVVQLEAEPVLIGTSARVDHAVIGPLADVFNMMTDQIEMQPSAAQRNQALADAAARARDGFLKFVADSEGRSPMPPALALESLARALDETPWVLVDESITAAPPLQMAFRPQGADDFFAGRGGGIGQGLAAAIGVAVARTDVLVVAVSGDGSAMYSIQALWSAAHHDLNIVFVILANREYRVLKHNVDAHRKRFDDASDAPYPHMDLTEPGLSFVEMAQGMGVPGMCCEDPTGIRAAVQQALSTRGPYVLELVVAGKGD